MPIDQSTQPAEGTTRRTFLVRSAFGGALVTAGAVAAPILGLTSGAGAQEGDDELLTDRQFGAFTAPFELAAVQAYLAANRTELLDEAWTAWGRQFLDNHQATADTLATLLADDDPAPRADADLVGQLSTQLAAAGSQEAVLAVLATLEETLAATHLSAIPVLRDATTARTVSQVVAVESQQAALLGLASGATFDSLTPAEGTTDQAVPLDDAFIEATTTTTAAN